jgi:hypothetical protein
MKLIVAIKSACRRPRSLIRHCFLPKGRAGREVDALRADDHRVVQILNGMEVGSIGSPAVTARNLCGDVPQGRAPLRHVVISAEDVTGAERRREAFACLAAVAQDWIQAYAPNTNFLVVSHDDRRHPHIHLLLANSDRSDDESRLAWSPSTVSEMQSLDFVSDATKETYLVESGRHRGISRREQGGMPYPGARLDALKLANMTDKEIKEFQAPIRLKYETEGSAYYSTARLWDDGIIDPIDTRKVLALGLHASFNREWPEKTKGVFRM